MAELTMPKMGDAMEEGTLLRWLKSEGDPIAEEEPIAEIQTEKATIEVPSYVTGKLTKLLVGEGETVPVGTPIAQYEPAGGESDGAAAPRGAESAPPPADREPVPGATQPVPRSPGPPSPGAAREPAPPPPTRGAPAPAPSSTGPGAERVRATPLAKKVAAARGIDLTQVAGSGPGGRIVEADVERAAAQPPSARPTAPAGEARPSAAPSPVPPAPGARRPLSPMRKTIAKRLTEAKQTIPHFYVTMAIDMGAAARFREQLNARGSDRPPVPYDALILKACAAALAQFPAVNSQFAGDALVQPAGIHVGVAVALEEGLIVPVIRDADQKSLTAVAGELRGLVERARAGKLQPGEYTGGTFTLSNLGMYGVEQFIAVINPPESAILAVGAVQARAVVVEGEVKVGQVMEATLSVDHRVIDGAVAAQFLREVKRLLEAPLMLV